MQSSEATCTQKVVADPRNSFKTEIASFDVKTGRVDKFGEGNYANR